MRTFNTILSITCLLALVGCKSGKGDFDASGVFESTEILISAEATGKLMLFTVEEGQELKAGQTVGYIDTVQLHLKKMQLLANIGTVSTRRQSIPTQIAALEQQINTQVTERRRYENLVRANAANQKQLDDINSGIQVLEKQLAAQKELLVNSNKGVAEERSGLDIQIAQLNDQLEKSVIVSPINGTVLAKYAEPGEFASTGRALFKIADMENMYLRAYITASQLTEVKLGQQVHVSSDLGEKGSREYSGRITWISDKSEFTPKTIQTRDERANQVYAVKIAVENDGYLKNGMYGEIRFN